MDNADWEYITSIDFSDEDRSSDRLILEYEKAKYKNGVLA